jgi:hypothetical protein
VVADAAGVHIDAQELRDHAAQRPAASRDTAPLQILLRDLGLTQELAPALGMAPAVGAP